MTQHGPASTAHPQPSPVRLAIRLLYAVMALSVVSLVVSILISGSVTEAVVGKGQVSAGFADTATTIGLILGSIFTVASIALYVVLAVFTGRGHGWARIVLTVVAALAVLGAIFSLGSLVLSSSFGAPVIEPPAYTAASALLSLGLWGAIGVLLWRPASNTFFAAEQAARAQRVGPAQ